MAAGGEDLKAGAWIDAQLAAASAVTALVPLERIYAEQAPGNAARPNVVHWLRSPLPDSTGVAGARILVELDFVVEAVSDTDHSMEELLDVVEAIDAALDMKSGASADLMVYSCRRTETWAPPVVIDEDGTRVYRRGGNYRVTCRSI